MKETILPPDFKVATGVLLGCLLVSACAKQPTRTTSSTGDAYNVEMTEGEGLTTIPGIECNKPIDSSWPKVSVHIPNNGKSKNKEVSPKSVEIEVLTEANERLKNFTMLKGQKQGTLALRPIMNKGPLKIRVSQNFIWKNAKKDHYIQNVVYRGTIDRENICLSLPQYKTVTATIKLSPKFINEMSKEKLDLSKGYIEARNQLGELSVDMKVKYDPSRSTAGIPNVWKTDLLMKDQGGKVTFTPSPWSTTGNEFKRQDSVSVDVSPNQKDITVEIK